MLKPLDFLHAERSDFGLAEQSDFLPVSSVNPVWFSILRILVCVHASTLAPGDHVVATDIPSVAFGSAEIPDDPSSAAIRIPHAVVIVESKVANFLLIDSHVCP